MTVVTRRGERNHGDRKRLVLGTATTHPDHVEVPPHGWAVHTAETPGA